MAKWLVWGALIGIFLGIVLYLAFPYLLRTDFFFNILFRSSLGYPKNYYDPVMGSVFSVGTFIPFALGLLGSLMGFIGYNLKKLSNNKTGRRVK